MKKVLFLIHTESDGTLSKLSLEALTAAKKLSFELKAEIVTGIFGGRVKDAANSISAMSPSAFYGVEGEDFRDSRYSTDAAAAEAICRACEAECIVSPATMRISRMLAGVSERLNGRIDTHLTGFKVSDGNLYIRRCYYRQRIETCLSRTNKPWFLTVDGGNFEPFPQEARSVDIEILRVDVGASLRSTRQKGYRMPPENERTIKPDAELLFVAGAGWTKKQSDGKVHAPEASDIIRGFLKKSDASLGGSKSVVDQSSHGEEVLSFMNHLNQVGQTGATPRHLRGLSTCCHGEEPHVVGWRFIKERRAINIDPGCGWAQGKTDVLYVADAFEEM